MTPEQIYFKHVAGSSALMAWCRRWMHVAGGVSLKDNTATLGAVSAQRFGIAWPKRKRFAKGPSLLYQTTEAAWMEHICWCRAVLQPFSGSEPAHLALIAKMIAGDDSKFMNVPAFALRIPLGQDNADLWMELSKAEVDLRQIWHDEDARESCVSNPSVCLSLHTANPTDPLFNSDELQGVTPFHELLEKRLRETGIENNPGFAGSAAPVNDEYIKAQQDYRKNLGSPDVVGSLPSLSEKVE